MSHSLHLTAAVGRDGDQFWARCLEVEERMAYGASPQEAVDTWWSWQAHRLTDLPRPYLPHALIVPSRSAYLGRCAPDLVHANVAQTPCCHDESECLDMLRSFCIF